MLNLAQNDERTRLRNERTRISELQKQIDKYELLLEEARQNERLALSKNQGGSKDLKQKLVDSLLLALDTAP